MAMPELLGQSRHAQAGRGHLQNAFVRNRAPRTRLISSRTAASDHVVRVVAGCSDVKVLGVAARRVIAAMQNPLSRRDVSPKLHHLGQLVRAQLRALDVSDAVVVLLSFAGLLSAARPFVTAGFRVDAKAGLEAVDLLLREVAVDVSDRSVGSVSGFAGRHKSFRLRRQFGLPVVFIFRVQSADTDAGLDRRTQFDSWSRHENRELFQAVG